MRVRHVLLAAALGFTGLTAATGCAKNPADDKPKAQVGEAVDPKAAEGDEADKPAEAPTGQVDKAPEADKAAAATKLAVSPDNSEIAFTGSKVTGKHDGGFKQFSGSVELTGDDPATAKIDLTIEMASVFTDSEKLTGHLQSDDFFSVPTHPKATFQSTAVKAGGEGGATHTVTGNLTLRGVTKSITFPATIAVAGDKVTAKSEFAINRKDFGINYAGMQDDLIRDEVVLRLDLQLPR